MATAQDIIKGALRLIGAIGKGETPEDHELQDGLEALNQMLDTLSIKRKVIFARTEENFTLIVGQGDYDIGTNTERPIRIEKAYIRETATNTDTPVKIITEGEYNDIHEKFTQGRPYLLYYDPQYPAGLFFLYFVPDKAYKLFVDSWKPFTRFAALTTVVTFPPGYERMLKYNLTSDIASEYGLEVPSSVARVAKKSLKAIKNVNAERLISKTGLPTSKGKYDINSNRVL